MVKIVEIKDAEVGVKYELRHRKTLELEGTTTYMVKDLDKLTFYRSTTSIWNGFSFCNAYVFTEAPTPPKSYAKYIQNDGKFNLGHGGDVWTPGAFDEESARRISEEKLQAFVDWVKDVHAGLTPKRGEDV